MNQSNFTGDVRGSIPLRCLLLHPGLITKATLTVAYVALLIVACVENTLVIYLVRTCKDLRQRTFNYLIINMAVADMMDVCFATITFTLPSHRLPSRLLATIGFPVLLVKSPANLYILYCVCQSVSPSPRW